MLKKEMITYLIVHCADTPDAEDLRATDIHEMHLGFGWDGAGYHHIICRDGQIEPGRPFYWQGAHVYGQNENSLGICLIGRQKFTPAQMNILMLKLLVIEMFRILQKPVQILMFALGGQVKIC
mgnify:CR=1 FL=1